MLRLVTNHGETQEHRPKGAGNEGAGALPHALIACREVSARKWGTRWLEREGFQVSTATDGSQALELFENLRTAVVLVAAGLRDGEGNPLHSALRRLPRGEEVPILALCANDREAMAALEEGCADVTTRPFNWQIISQRAGRLARASKTEGELEQTRTMLQEARAAVDASRKRAEELATIDPLTGLPNREIFRRVLEDTLAANRSESGSVAVLLIDLDRFKTINSALGRHAGNKVLQQVAQRLRGCLRGNDVMSRQRPGLATSALARMNGDVFTLMLSNVAGPEEISTVCRNLAGAIEERFFLSEEEIFLSASMGVAFAPSDGKEAEELLQRAELALCEAKRDGGGIARFYNNSQNLPGRDVEIHRELRASFERGELEVHYQPLVDSVSQRVMGAEALLRWEHPEMGRVSPAEFVPLAEETGFMVQIGTWVLKTAARQLRTWIDQGLMPIRMSVNVSLCQLLRSDLAATVAEVLGETRLQPDLIELELSERGALRSDRDILRQLSEIKAMGVRLSVDDFGTGNSAIAYLRRFPLDALKIDRSYVSSLSCDNDAAITSATVAMAKQLCLEVIAEGVEEQEQLEFLRLCGCDEYQGFLFSPAVHPDDFRRFIEESHRGATTGGQKGESHEK